MMSVALVSAFWRSQSAATVEMILKLRVAPPW